MMVRLAFLSIVVLLLGNLQASGHGEPEWIGTVEIGGVKWQYAKIEFEDGVYQVQPSKKKIAKMRGSTTRQSKAPLPSRA